MLCKCGCGGQAGYHRGKPNQYILGHNQRGKTGEKNQNWKGDNIGYNQLHDRIRKNLPKQEFCQICGTRPPHDVACVTGIYNLDFKNWLRLCRSCHEKLEFATGHKSYRGIIKPKNRVCKYCGLRFIGLRVIGNWYGNEDNWTCSKCYKRNVRMIKKEESRDGIEINSVC